MLKILENLQQFLADFHLPHSLQNHVLHIGVEILSDDQMLLLLLLCYSLGFFHQCVKSGHYLPNVFCSFLCTRVPSKTIEWLGKCSAAQV